MSGLDWRRWPNFTREEMACRGTGECRMEPSFMDLLQRLRESFAAPLVISSGYRAPAYNAKVSATGADGPHTTGCAADILVHGRGARLLVWRAVELGFAGIGINQRGPAEARFIHLDTLEARPGRPRPWLWTY